MSEFVESVKRIIAMVIEVQIKVGTVISADGSQALVSIGTSEGAPVACHYPWYLKLSPGDDCLLFRSSRVQQ